MSDAGGQTTDDDVAVAAASDGLRVLFVDNFDSFTYNLVEYVEEALLASSDHANSDDSEDVRGHTETKVVRNTASIDEIRAFDPDAVIISPGPGHPKNDRDVGVTMDVLRDLSPDVPTLGVCLGLEAAVYAYGGTVGRAPDPIHGKASSIDHDETGVFAGLDQGLRGGRYHSLVATEVPECFEVTATAEHGDEELVMGIRHREHPIECVQFHPESVLTSAGHDIIENFLSTVQ
ncbi:anthranilate synthase component 2 [Natronoarchaeum philippinense]|uniref:anthranilate synthase n=1 Tax=Natronoarchaeum philippinense TaxID=558529 RepID=A0A285P7M7_NATPI|nr:anthranilate synthase component II [Natronoarchaeum philippinense]SNZ17267.1 anthranilate synthase component 2 [Natronoarchaeum philippinense]